MKKIFYISAFLFAFLGLNSLQLNARNGTLLREKIEGSGKLRIAEIIQQDLSDQDCDVEVVIYDELEAVVYYNIVNPTQPMFIDADHLDDNSTYMLEVYSIDDPE